MFICGSIFVFCFLLVLVVSDLMAKYGETRGLRCAAQVVALLLLSSGAVFMLALIAAIV